MDSDGEATLETRGTKSSRAEGIPSVSRPLISLRGYSYRYPDSSWGLQDVSLTIAEGESVAIVGENGAGKTTLARCIMGLGIGTGSHEFDGEPVTHRNGGLLWRQMGIVFQDPADQLFSPSCREEVAFGPRQMGLSKDETLRRVEEALQAVELAGYEDRVPHHLSGGERKRLAIASVLSMKPRVLILDEPTVHLDPRSEEFVVEILRRLEITKILISHDMPLILALCRRTVVLHQGKIIRDYLSTELQGDHHLVSINGLDYTYKNDCCREIMALQEDFEAKSSP